MGGRSDQFESELYRAKEELDRAKDRYETIEGHVPDEFVEALQELEAQLETLNTVSSVDDENLEEVQRTEGRIGLLGELLDSLGQHDADVIESVVQRQRLWADLLGNLAEQDSVDDETEAGLAGVNEQIGLFEKLIDTDKHPKVTSNDRFTPADVERELRELDRQIRASSSDEAYKEICLQGTEDYIEKIYSLLGEIRDQNPDRTAFADHIQTVKSVRTEASTEEDPETARTALEGSLMLFDSVSRAVSRQTHAQRLADAITENELSAPIQLEELAAAADIDALTNVIADAVDDATEESERVRLKRLLTGHDGSVRRTVSATNFDVDEMFELLQTMFEDETIADLDVIFDQ